LIIRNRYLLLADVFLLLVASFLSFLIRFDGHRVWHYLARWWFFPPLVIAISLPVFYFFGLYRRMWQYASVNELLAIVTAVSLSGFITTLLIFGLFVPLRWIPFFSRSIVAINWLLMMALVGGARFSVRLLWEARYGRRAAGQANHRIKQILIVGAGDAGAMVVRELKNNPQLGLVPVGLIDDDSRKWGQYVHGVPVLGACQRIPSLARRMGVDEVVIAMPTAPGKVIRAVRAICERANLPCRTVPGFFELLAGKVTISHIREVRLEDLLRREPTEINMPEMADYLTGARVLVTGAGGSIGSELCRQIAHQKPKELLLLGHGEHSIFQIEWELRWTFPNLPLRSIIADIRNTSKVQWIFDRYRPEIVFHAAAYKHVPLMEENVDEAVTNNILGTRNLIQAAAQASVRRFVLISSDKAVNPTTVMGATKRVAELLVQSAAQRYPPTRFVVVRFGNVLGSRGSVISIFRKEIALGGPLTVHPEATRYFMTIPEAVQLVIHAAAMGKGGEIFVLDMGAPIRIIDLAHDLVELSGLELGRDIDIVFTDLRPGEKLHEELFTSQERKEATQHEKIFIAQAPQTFGDQLWEQVEELLEVTRDLEPKAIRRQLQLIVPEFHPAVEG